MIKITFSKTFSNAILSQDVPTYHIEGVLNDQTDYMYLYVSNLV